MNRIILALLPLAAASLPAQALDRECFARVRLAEGGGFIRSYQAAGDNLEVVVSEDIWNEISAPSRQGLITTLNCALRRDGQPFARIRVRSDRTNTLLGEASGNTLAPTP